MEAQKLNNGSQPALQQTDVIGRLMSDPLNDFVYSLLAIVKEYSYMSDDGIANEIKNRIDCFYLSDREAYKDNSKETGVKDNIDRMMSVLNAL